jgi:hypothetical protein
MVSSYAERPGRELTLLRLTLSGVTDPERYKRIVGEFRDIIKRYYPGSSLVADAVLVETDPDRLNRIVGDGVLSRVLARLRDDAHSPDDQAKCVADHALKLLYRIAWEEQGV